MKAKVKITCIEEHFLLLFLRTRSIFINSLLKLRFGYLTVSSAILVYLSAMVCERDVVVIYLSVIEEEVEKGVK